MWFLRSNPIVLLPLWAFIVMFAFWWTKGRDPKPDISVAPMYEPPKDMTPAEVGTLIDDVSPSSRHHLHHGGPGGEGLSQDRGDRIQGPFIQLIAITPSTR